MLCLSSCATLQSKKTGDFELKPIVSAYFKNNEKEFTKLLGQINTNKKIREQSTLRAFYYGALFYTNNHDFEKAALYLKLLDKNFRRLKFKDEAAFAQCEFFYEKNNLKDAINGLNDFRKKYSESSLMSSVMYLHAMALQKNGQFSDAQKVFAELRKRFPLSFEADELEKCDLETVTTFGVQIASYFDCDNARSFLDQTKPSRDDLHILRTLKDNAVYYRVISGSFEKRSDALKHADTLKNAGYDGTVYP